jgi:2-polyprenyl-3-methyl-5-hydroxy-6-metoxy-1,4-benzoquinol methylase
MKKEIRCNLCGSSVYRILCSEGFYKILCCSQCELTFLDSQPSDEEINSIYSERYYLNNYLRYQDVRLNYFRERVKEIEKITDGRKIIDIGCGVGYFLRVAKERGWKVGGVEPSKFAAEYGKNEFGLQIENKHFLDISLKENYDVVTFWDVIAHTRNPLGHLRLANQILSNSGLVVVKSPNRPQVLFYIASVISKIIESRGLLHIPAQLYHFTPKTMEKMLDKAGFEILKLELVDDVKLPVDFWGNKKFYAAKSLYVFLKLFGIKESFIIYAKKK